MKKDFEKYFLGEMTDAERRRFEEELANDPGLKARFEEDQDFLEQLRVQMLREKVKAAMSTPDIAEGAKPVSEGKKKWGWLALVFLVMLGGWAVWGWVDREPSEPAAPVPAVAPQPPEQEEKDSLDVPVAGQNPTEEKPPVQEDAAPKPERQIATKVPENLEAHPLQGARGEAQNNTPWKTFVEGAWYAPLPGKAGDFPLKYKPALAAILDKKFMDAYSALEGMDVGKAANDTLTFLKGYCLLELWEGREALRHFNNLNGKNHPWQAETEWYKGLSFLLLGQKKEALGVFREIAAKPGHRFQKRAKTAAGRLSVEK